MPPSRAVNVSPSRAAYLAPSRASDVPPSRSAYAPPSRAAYVPPSQSKAVYSLCDAHVQVTEVIEEADGENEDYELRIDITDDIERTLVNRSGPSAPSVSQSEGHIYNNALILVESPTIRPPAPINVRNATHSIRCADRRCEFH